MTVASRPHRGFISSIGVLAAFLLALVQSLSVVAPVAAADAWTVSIRVHEATSKTDDDADGPDDMFWDVSLAPTIGTGDPAFCDREENHEDDKNHITPTDWICTVNVTGGANTTVQIVLELWDHDTTSENDEFDINPAPGQLGLLMTFTPSDLRLAINGVAGRDTLQCVPGRVKLRGIDGDDQAEIVFSVSASLVGAPDGDSDNDGLADTWEVCGIDGDGDGTRDVNLAGMGADRFRKDLFVETDWMTQPGAGGHSHAPWLPSLINAWHEYDVAQVTNPTVGGVQRRGGIALHVDTGTLYSGYNVDFNGDGTNEITVPATGDFDVNGDGTIDIGNIGVLSGDPVGGNQLAENPMMLPNQPAPAPGTALPFHSFFDVGSDFANIKNANFQAARDWAFHYVVFGHQYRSSWVGAATDNSSGLADDCPGVDTCNNVIVSLGNRQGPALDQTGPAGIPDGIPDPAVAAPLPAPLPMLGPGGVPVRGTILQHTGTFMHELGHNLGLRHGGIDDINNKPNFPSIMSYAWQMSGVSFDTALPANTIDPVPQDFDHNGFPDLRRFIYSGVPGLNPALAMLNEGVNPSPFLDETIGIGADPVMTTYSCPSPAPPATPGPPATRLLRGNQPLDWDCSVPGQTNVQADINNLSPPSGVLEQLNGGDDYARLQNGGLRFNALLPGITLEDEVALKSSQVRVIEPEGRQEAFAQTCESPRTIDFEDHSPGTPIAKQYKPLVTFLSDGRRMPEIVDGPGRNNVPTQSQTNSLVNRVRREPVPMVLGFDTPVRTLSLYFGQAGLASSRSELVRAVFSAFDQNGLPMGEIAKSLPLPSAGITEYLTIITIWPDEFIKRLEIRYEIDGGDESRLLDEPVQIDDLTVCEVVRPVTPTLPKSEPPVFGTITVHLTVRSERIVPGGPADGEADHQLPAKVGFSGLPVTVDGTPTATDLALTRPEGTTIVVTAPPDHGGGRFDHWEHSSGASFGVGNLTIPLTLLSDGVLTAVYLGGESEHRAVPTATPR